jgi:hypothetical protein
MIYENAKTLSDEQSVANLIATLWHVRMTKPPGYGRDRIIHDSEGRPIGVLEIKVRTNAWRRYPTYMIDLAKVAGMRSEVERGDAGPPRAAGGAALLAANKPETASTLQVFPESDCTRIVSLNCPFESVVALFLQTQGSVMDITGVQRENGDTVTFTVQNPVLAHSSVAEN